MPPLAPYFSQQIRHFLYKSTIFPQNSNLKNKNQINCVSCIFMENSNDNSTVVTASNNMSNVGDHSAVSENPAVVPTQRALKHNIELSVNWSREEQSLLEELLARYASDTAILRYSKIALQLQDKTIRDVALRSRWMLNKEIKKKEIRKQIKDESHSSRRHKEIREKPANQEAGPSFHAESNGNGLPDAQPSTPMDNDDVISIAIGGVTGQLLDNINRAMDQVDANFSTFRENSNLLEVQKNINLIYQIRNNILAVTNELNHLPGTPVKMPPLPVKLDDELLNYILHLQ